MTSLHEVDGRGSHLKLALGVQGHLEPHRVRTHRGHRGEGQAAYPPALKGIQRQGPCQRLGSLDWRPEDFQGDEWWLLPVSQFFASTSCSAMLLENLKRSKKAIILISEVIELSALFGSLCVRECLKSDEDIGDLS